MKFPEIAKRFRFILNEKNIKQQELSEKTGINKASISQYVNGSHCPSNEKATILGNYLNVSPLWLMGLSDNMIETTQEDKNRETQFMELYSQLNDNNRELVDNMIQALSKKQ